MRADTPVLVDFWATWCTSCPLFAPVIDELASDYAGKVVVVKVNVKDTLQYARHYDVRQTPTILLFCNGEEKGRIIGAGKKSLYVSKLEALLGE